MSQQSSTRPQWQADNFYKIGKLGNVFCPRQEDDNPDAELSWAAIVGFTVKDAATNKPLGALLAVDDSTVNTLFEVDVNGSALLLLPASYDLIAGVDAKKREITMHIPDGILDLD